MTRLPHMIHLTLYAISIAFNDITFTYVAAVRVIRPYILNSAVPGVQQPSRTTSPAHLDIVKSNNSSMQLCFNTKCIGTVVVEKVTEMEGIGIGCHEYRTHLKSGKSL